MIKRKAHEVVKLSDDLSDFEIELQKGKVSTKTNQKSKRQKQDLTPSN